MYFKLKSYNSDDSPSDDYAEMQKKCLVVTGAILCEIFFVIGVVLWIAAGVVVSDPPDGSKYKSWFT